MNNISVGAKKVNFSKVDFLANSAKVTDGAYADYDQMTDQPHTHAKLNVFDLKPIVNDINMNDIFLKIARYVHKNVKFVITSDLYVISCNDQLAIQQIIHDENKHHEVCCELFPFTLTEYFGINSAEQIVDDAVVENGSGDAAAGFGTQGPEQSGRMGDVKFPEVSTAPGGTMHSDYEKGSGDFPGTGAMKIYDEEDDVNERFMTEDELREIARRHREEAEAIEEALSAVNESANDLNTFIDSNKESLTTFAAAFGVDIESLKAVTENANLKLEKHFENSEEVLNTCKVDLFTNIPVVRRAAVVDTDFSCNTLEGVTQGKAGDLVVIGVDGEIYPCDVEVFSKTYQKITL